MHRSARLLILPLMLAAACALHAQDTTWFRDATAAAGLTGVHGFRLNIVDIDNDTYPDLLLENGLSNRDKLTRIMMNRPAPGATNPHQRTFVDVTAESGIFANPYGDTGRVIDIATMADVNNDGNLDLVTGTYFDRVEAFAFQDDRDEVMLGDGAGHFKLVENNGLHELGLLNTAGFTFLDYDLDGKLDVYVTTWFADKTNNIGAINYLMHGNGDGTFTNATVAAGMDLEDWPEYGATAVDWNNDGLPDIFTSPYCRSGGNLWKNNGNGTFTDMAQPANYSSQHTTGDVDGSGPRALCQWAAQPADYDNDGDLDIAQVLVHGGLDAGEGRTGLSINKGAAAGFAFDWKVATFPRDAPRSVHLGDQDGWWLDMDNDGAQDFMIAQCVYDATHDRSYLLRQNTDHTFTDVTGECGLLWLKETHNMRPFDFDNDGDEDILVEIWRKSGTVVSDLALIENRIGDRNNHATVKLAAPAGVNRGSIGARITVYSGGMAQMREVMAGQGHFGAQSPLEKVFGLGAATTVDSIVVRWPSRTEPNTVVVNPPANALLVIGRDGLVPQSVAAPVPVAVLDVTPNPAHDRVHVRMPNDWHGGRLELFDARGAVVDTRAIDAATTELELSLDRLAAGVYQLRLTGADARVAETRLVRK